MCLLFLFLIATFVGLTPIMVYRSLGVPLPEGFKEYRNVYAPLSSVSFPALSADRSYWNPPVNLG